jgi:hypothetical protein
LQWFNIEEYDCFEIVDLFPPLLNYKHSTPCVYIVKHSFEILSKKFTCSEADAEKMAGMEGRRMLIICFINKPQSILGDLYIS